jgi:hypothetical protein
MAFFIFEIRFVPTSINVASWPDALETYRLLDPKNIDGRSATLKLFRSRQQHAQLKPEDPNEHFIRVTDSTQNSCDADTCNPSATFQCRRPHRKCAQLFSSNVASARDDNKTGLSGKNKVRSVAAKQRHSLPINNEYHHQPCRTGRFFVKILMFSRGPRR